MLNVGLIGIGNTGNQVAALAKERLGVPVMAINSSEKDLETVPAGIQKMLIADAKGQSRGAGKNRALAKEYLRDSIMGLLSSDTFREFIPKQDIVFIVSSTGGGTGSGTAPLMATILSQSFPNTKIILVGVLPVNNEALSSHVNTLEYLNELYTSMNDITYMLYDNDRLSNMPSYQMMEKVNQEIVSDIDVIRCTYNYTTKYDSIDEQDMKRLISSPGRLMVTRVEDIKEKDIDNKSIEDMLIDTMKKNCHVEMQRDKKVVSTGIITNLSQTLSESFDNHLPLVTEFIGESIHDFNHIFINPDRKLPNQVFLIMSGLSPINDKINHISDRVDEIEEKQKIRDEENAMSNIDMSQLTDKVTDKNAQASESVNLKSIFEKFGVN